MSIHDDIKLIRELANVKNVSVEDAAENTGYLIEDSDMVLLSFMYNNDYPAQEKERMINDVRECSVPNVFGDALWDTRVITNIVTGEPTPWTVFVKDIINYLKSLP